MASERDRLIGILRQKSLQVGEFRLTSGMTSYYYFDSKPTTLDPEGAYLTARLMLERIREEGLEAEAIGGMTMGADPIVSAVAAVSYVHRERYRPLSAFIVRKEAKKHGTRRFIEGPEAAAGTPVIIVDDVCTTGGSTLAAIRRAEEVGYRVSAVLCLVDRQQGGAQLLCDYPFFPLFTATELLHSPEIQQSIAELKGRHE